MSKISRATWGIVLFCMFAAQLKAADTKLPSWLSSADVVLLVRACDGNWGGSKLYVTEVWKAVKPFAVSRIDGALHKTLSGRKLEVALLLIRLTPIEDGPNILRTLECDELGVTDDLIQGPDGRRYNIGDLRRAMQSESLR